MLTWLGPAPALVGRTKTSFLYECDLREVSPPHDGARKDPETADVVGGEEEPEEATEQLEVGPAVPHKALGVEDEEIPQGEDDDEKKDFKKPPAVGEEHGETEGEYEGVPANSLHSTKDLP